MLDAIARLCYPAEVIRQLAVRILNLGPEVADEPSWWPFTAASQEDHDHFVWHEENLIARQSLIRPECLDPAEQFRVAYSKGEFAPDADIIRETVGNPFAPPFVRREWLTSDVLALARGILSEKAFDRMPILGDALMDAGCHDEAVLGHCRQDQPHHDGCWVLSLLLGVQGSDPHTERHRHR
jgi:hypothetical protein